MRSQLSNFVQVVPPASAPSAPQVRQTNNKQPLASNVINEEESLVLDDRAAIRPAQMVENKLSRILRGSCLGVSHLRLKSLIVQRTRQ